MTRSVREDEQWMHRAVELARLGEGLTRPNPPVGAILVRKGRVVGEGYHRRAGGPHAEIHALRQAGQDAAGATLYLTLEPCSTHGRTPPCTDAILAAGVKRLVIGVHDPNPAHQGRGLRALRRHGMVVRTGVLKGACDELIAPFRAWIQTGRPYVTLKLALTIDGRIADRHGQSKWITGPAARGRVQALRRRADAIMVGAETVRKDDPSLLPRPAGGRKPWRVIVSSSGRLPRGLRVFNDAAADRTIVTVRGDAGGSRPAGEWLPLRPAGSGVSMKDLLRKLGKRGVLVVLCEGGGHLAGDLVRADLVDEFVFFLAPSLLGGKGGTSALEGVGWLMRDRPHLEITGTEQLGADLCVRARRSCKEN